MKKLYCDYLKQKINNYLNDYNLKLKDFSIRVGMSEKTLIKSLNGEREFYLSELTNIINVLSLSSDEKELIFTKLELTYNKSNDNSTLSLNIKGGGKNE